MKVSNTAAKGGEAIRHSGGTKSGAVGAVAGAGAMESSFADVVDDMETRQLLAELDDLGSQMTRYPTSALISRYRELVRMVLQKVRNGMQIRRDFKWRRTERSMFITIERTEGLLDELAELGDVLGREADRTRMLSLIDEIKGCLISLIF